jgi:hypothetical protein
MPPTPEPPREGGGPNPPYGEDFFQRIINVHWLSGPPPLPPGKGIAVLLPTIGLDVTILSLPVVRRTVLKDGFTEFGT